MGCVVSITLYTVVEGEHYAQFIPRWWESVQHMTPAPDEVLIVTGKTHRDTIESLDPQHINLTILHLDQPFSNAYFRAGVEYAASEWIGFSGIDDIMLPNGYKDVAAADAAHADIMVGTIILSNGAIWRGTWNTHALTQHNTLPAHSPFRRDLYDQAGGFPDIHWSDWGFWLRCATIGAKPFHSPEPIAIFDIGDTHETMSGVGLDPRKRIQADQELRTFIANL